MSIRQVNHSTNSRWALGICACLLFLLISPAALQAQIRPAPTGGTLGRSLPGINPSRSSSSSSRNNTSNPLANDSSYTQTDTSATKGLVFHTETPDSILRQKVFLFHHRTGQVWIDQVWNPTLNPTGIQFYDPIDALDGNYYLGKGSLGHPHIALFPTLADGLNIRLQPDLFPAYSFNLHNIYYFQTTTPFTTLTYGGSLDNDHSLRITHTQNIIPGWNASIDYRLFNPEGIYTSSGALNNHLAATTNYFSHDSRLQASAALIWQAFNIDENGGLSNDSIFILRQQSNLAGIPVRYSNAGSIHRNLAAKANIIYSLQRQSDKYRHRDSLTLVQVNDSTTRMDTLDVIDTIPLRAPHTLNPGVIGLELNYNRQKRVFTDSTHLREQRATIFWTNDAYPDHRWCNPLKITVGLQPRYLRAVIYGDTLRNYSWLNPFVNSQLSIHNSKLSILLSAHAEQSANPWSDKGRDRRLATTLTIKTPKHQAPESRSPEDSNSQFSILNSQFSICLGAVWQDQAPDLIMLWANGYSPLRNQTIQRYHIQFRYAELIDINASANHLSHNTWIDTLLGVHEGITDLWLLQASLLLRLKAGPIHLDMQQLLQHSTDSHQLPVPLWASKNSLYADFPMFDHTLQVQLGVDLRYHTPYHAPLYDPATGLFLQQQDITVGGYLWADAFINLQVKRASIYLKAGHVNALWETPATYFLLPHYPGSPFGLAWGLSWAFFD